MKKVVLLLALAALMAPMAWAATRGVVTEFFTATW